MFLVNSLKKRIQATLKLNMVRRLILLHQFLKWNNFMFYIILRSHHICCAGLNKSNHVKEFSRSVLTCKQLSKQAFIKYSCCLVDSVLHYYFISYSVNWGVKPFLSLSPWYSRNSNLRKISPCKNVKAKSLVLFFE